MRHLGARGASLRGQQANVRRVTLFAAALMVGAVLGPLTGIAVGEGAGTKTVITVPAGCTTATTTPTTTTTPTVPATTTITGTTVTSTTPVMTTATLTGPVTAPTGGGGLGGSTTTATTPTSPTTTTTTTTVPTCTTTTVTVKPSGPYVPPANTAAAPGVIRVPKESAFARHGMWIWELPATDGGNVAAIIAKAKQDHIGTLYIKSGDGTTAWTQFTKTLVREIHAAGLDVCAWQYIYGNDPAEEAAVGALAKADGANCLVIDAESQYEGKYVSAQTYIKDLRRRIGKTYPVGLAGLPYISYHTSFPYSVFLGPDGAQYNLPQMYWIDIGTTVPYVFQTTYEYNRIYKRPIFPLGQLYADSEGSPTAASIGQFDTIAKDYKASGTSWWDFQSATNAWMADTNDTAAAPANFTVSTDAATVIRGNRGDLVIWAQEHLDGAGADLPVNGDFGAAMALAVEAFQLKHKLTPNGQITGKTWDALLKYNPPSVTWSLKGRKTYATVKRPGKKTLGSTVSLLRR